MSSTAESTVSVEAINPEAPRLEPGDVSELAESIASVGLRHPILLTDDGRLLSGSRRLRACRQIGWTEIPVRVLDTVPAIADALKAERDGVSEKPMLLSEQARQGLAIEALGRRERHEKYTTKDPKTNQIRFLVSGWSQVTIAEALGMNETLYRRAKVIVQNAEGSDVKTEVRESALLNLERMDKTGRVYGAFTDLWKVKRAAEGGSEPPHKRMVPAGKDGTYTAKQIYEARSQHDKLWKSLRTLSVIARELPALKFHFIPVIADENEIKEVIELYDRSIDELTQFRRSLQERLGV